MQIFDGRIAFCSLNSPDSCREPQILFVVFSFSNLIGFCGMRSGKPMRFCSITNKKLERKARLSGAMKYCNCLL